MNDIELGEDLLALLRAKLSAMIIAIAGVRNRIRYTSSFQRVTLGNGKGKGKLANKLAKNHTPTRMYTIEIASLRFLLFQSRINRMTRER